MCFCVGGIYRAKQGKRMFEISKTGYTPYGLPVVYQFKYFN